MFKDNILKRRGLIFLLLLLLAALGAGWIITDYLGNRARQELYKDNEETILLLSTHLTDELRKIEGAVKAMSGSPWIHPALISSRDEHIAHANSALDRYNSAIDASVSYLMNIHGVTIASSNRNDPDSFVGKSYNFRPYFTQAMHGNQGRYFALGITSQKKGFYASFPVLDNNNKIIGVAAMKKDLDEFERQLSSYPYCFVVNRHGIIFLSSNNEMSMKSLWPVSKLIERELLTTKQFGDKPFEALFQKEFMDRTDVDLQGDTYLVSRKLIDSDGWSIILLAPTDRVTIYQSIGVILTVVICLIIAVPFTISYHTVKSTELVRKSEKRFQQVAQSSQDWIWETDSEGMYTYSSQAVKHILDYEPEEIIGRHYYDFFVPEEREELTQIFKGFFSRKEAYFRVVNKRIHRDGHEIFVESTGIPRLDKRENLIGFRGTNRDISKRVNVEKALRESEERYRILAEKSLVGVYVIQDGKFRFLNYHATANTGYTEDDLLGKESMIFVHPEDREELKKNALDMLQGKRTSAYEFRTIAKNGQIRWFMETVSSITWLGKRAVLGNWMDITERKRLESEILSLSMTDQLTGLHNRRGFLTLAEQQLKIAERTKEGMLLFFMDLDGMKWINDTLGHKIGDEALIEVATILKETFRASDVIARIGGDEFAVLAIDEGGSNTGILTSRLQKQIDAHNSFQNRLYKISISIGYTHYDPQNPSSIDELMSSADILMYEEKKKRRDRVHGNSLSKV
jgi:diguanylate cyclase (GGDEF)-like protein/PAS domain S-box-containing protein